VGLAPNVPLVLAGPALASVPAPGPEDDLTLARAADHESAGLDRAAEDLARAERLRGRAALPVVELGAQYARLVHTPGYDDFYKTFKPDSWAVGLSVVVPVLTGGRTGDARARAQAALERVEAQRRDRASKLEIEVRRAEADLARGLARASLARRAEAVAEEGLRVTRALADEGRADPAALDQRELALADAVDERLRAEASLLQARVASLALRGELLSTLAGPRTAPAVTENPTEAPEGTLPVVAPSAGH
jgi:outer membrane protein TolC